MSYWKRLATQKALTLLELIVVIVILGVLAAIAIPTFLRVINKSKASTWQVTADSVMRDAQANAALTGRSAPNATDFATALAEVSATAAGNGVFAAGSGTNLKSALTLASTSTPFQTVTTPGMVSLSLPGTQSATITNPTAVGMAFLAPNLHHTAIFAYASGNSAPTTWVNTSCSTVNGIAAASDNPTSCSGNAPAATATITPTPGWTLDASATTPPTVDHRRAAIAYDASTSSLVMVRDSGSAELTYTWNGTKWAQQSPTTSPTSREMPALGYDPQTGDIVLFGGYGPVGTYTVRTGATEYKTEPMSTTWLYDGTTWTKQSPTTVPPARSGASLVYDSSSDQLLLMQGNTRRSTLWEWSGTNWLKQPTPAPQVASTGASVAYDPASSSAVLFGGTLPATYPTTTATFQGGTWTIQHPSTLPPGRATFSMAYDATTNSVVVYGGSFNTTNNTTVWTWAGTNWTAHALATPPAVTGVLAYDTATNSLIYVVAGTTGGSTYTLTP